MRFCVMFGGLKMMFLPSREVSLASAASAARAARAIAEAARPFSALYATDVRSGRSGPVVVGRVSGSEVYLSITPRLETPWRPFLRGVLYDLTPRGCVLRGRIGWPLPISLATMGIAVGAVSLILAGLAVTVLPREAAAGTGLTLILAGATLLALLMVVTRASVRDQAVLLDWLHARLDSAS
jgi:hypothetical protein